MLTAALLLTATPLLTACGSEEVVPVGYGLVNERVLVLQVLAGPSDTVTAEVTDETSTAVVVEVQLKRDKDTSPDVEVTLTTEVPLAEPLSGRSVQDSSGVLIPRR